MNRLKWSEKCPVCEATIYVETTCEQTIIELLEMGIKPPYACDGDKWDCENGHQGYMFELDTGIVYAGESEE